MESKFANIEQLLFTATKSCARESDNVSIEGEQAGEKGDRAVPYALAADATTVLEL
jgi:hypothetical protein